MFKEKHYGLLNIEHIENITGYDFFSNIPTEIQKVIEDRELEYIRTKLPNIIKPAPLMATTQQELLGASQFCKLADSQ